MSERVTSLPPQSAMPSGGRVLADGLRLTVLPARHIVLLQLATHGPRAIGAIRIAGRPLPDAMNRRAGDDPVLCRIAPDSWLLLSPRHAAADLIEAARAGLRKRVAVLTELSDAHVTLALDGARAAAVIARGCGLDLDENAFGPDACARTRLAQLPVVIRRTTPQRFELLVDRSTAQYLFDWLQDAAVGVD